MENEKKPEADGEMIVRLTEGNFVLGIIKAGDSKQKKIEKYQWESFE